MPTATRVLLRLLQWNFVDAIETFSMDMVVPSSGGAGGTPDATLQLCIAAPVAVLELTMPAAAPGASTVAAARLSRSSRTFSRLVTCRLHAIGFSMQF
jgi:hypothetical protein